MSRRKRSFFVDLIDLPWWFSLVLAAGAWISGELVGAYGESLARAAAPQIHIQIITQIVPAATLLLRFFALLFCFTAVVSLYRRRRRAKLFESQTDLQSIRDLSWQDFERYVGEAYRRKGYTVEETGPGADGGIDLIARKNGETLLVQCKRYTKKKVSVTIARELFGLVHAHGATSGVLVTSGAFTPDALAFAEQTQLELVDGEGLVRLIQDVPRHVDVPDTHASPTETPSCPRCQSPMVKRTAKKVATLGTSSGAAPSFRSAGENEDWMERPSHAESGAGDGLHVWCGVCVCSHANPIDAL